MNRSNLNLTVLIATFLPLAGCGTSRVFYSPSMPPGVQVFDQSEVILAADFVQQPAPKSDTQSAKKDAPEQPAERKTAKDEKPAADAKTADGKKAEEKSRDEKPPYTVPGAQFRQFAAVALGAAAFGLNDVSGSGREAAESQVSSVSNAVFGRPGLSAPPTRVNQAVFGRPGLQQGFATGLGPANDRNIFTAMPNRLTGANGRCQELINAGFFNRNHATCEANFRR